jgi:beta-glucosidase
VDESNMIASVKITNTGNRLGKETVLWYVSDPEASITQPIKKLKHFEKIELKPNESKIVTFEIDKTSHLSYVDQNGNIIFESGDFKVAVGSLVKSFNVSDG